MIIVASDSITITLWRQEKNNHLKHCNYINVIKSSTCVFKCQNPNINYLSALKHEMASKSLAKQGLGQNEKGKGWTSEHQKDVAVEERCMYSQTICLIFSAWTASHVSLFFFSMKVIC